MTASRASLKRLGALLESRRLRLALDRDTLAAAVSTAAADLATIESGHRTPDTHTLLRLARILAIDLAEVAAALTEAHFSDVLHPLATSDWPPPASKSEPLPTESGAALADELVLQLANLATDADPRAPRSTLLAAPQPPVVDSVSALLLLANRYADIAPAPTVLLMLLAVIDGRTAPADAARALAG